MLFARKAVRLFELFQKGGGIGLEGTPTEGRNLLLASSECGSGFDVQPYIVLLGAGEHCVTEVSNAQSASCSS